MRRVQLRGGARSPGARRSRSTLSARTRAPTKEMGPYRRSAALTAGPAACIEREPGAAPGPDMDNDILHRVRILDFTTTIAGPHCTRLLADLGADVVKIEGPEGELMRTRPPLRDGVSSYFGQLNAGKRRLVLDLK